MLPPVRCFRSASLVVVALAVAACAPRPPASARAGEAFVARLQARVPELLARHHVPGAAIAVVRDGAVVWSQAFGRAAAGAAVADGTRFAAGSLGKPLFAYEVLLLARRGVIDLDRPLATVLPPPTTDARAARLTARMVLRHASGFPNWARGRPFMLAFAPGERWQYSGEAYDYLQRVVERLSGEPITVSLRRDLLTPLGMRHSDYVDPPAPEASWAQGHDRAGQPLPVDVHRTASAASSLRTTAIDYARFVAAVLAPPPDERALVAEMLTPAVAVEPELGLSWGLGWALAREGRDKTSHPIFFHWGSNPGFKSIVVAEPARHLALVMLTNGDDGLELAEAVVRAVDGDTHPLFRFPMLHPND